MNICSADRFRTYISFDGGLHYYSIKLIKAPKIKWQLQPKTYIYRLESEEWKFIKSENAGIYNLFLTYISNINTITTEILLRIDLYDDFASFDQMIYQGYVVLNNIDINEDTGVIKVKPEPKDNYHWWDKYKDFKIDLMHYIDLVSGGVDSFALHMRIPTTDYLLSYHWIDLTQIINFILAGIDGRIDAATNDNGIALTYTSEFFLNNPNIMNGRDLTHIAIAPMKDIIDRWTALNAGETPPLSSDITFEDSTL